MSKRLLILGLGNTLLCDDGVGIYISREIEALLSESDKQLVSVKEASVGGLELLDYLSGYDEAVIVDAVLTGKKSPGTILTFKVEDLQGGSAMSRHHVSPVHALELGRQLGMNLPEKIRFYGIEVSDTRTFKEACLPELTEKIPQLARDIMKRESLIESAAD